MVEFSVVTVTYNSRADLLATRRSLDDSVEWIVVDNASSDDSAEVAQRLGARVVRLGSNRGFSAANNVGIHKSSAPHILCANPDLSFDVQGLRALKWCATVGEQAFYVPQLVSQDGTLQPNGRGLPTIPRKLASRLGGSTRRYQVVNPRPVALYVAWAMGAAVFASREVWREVGWNERYFVYYEDHDLGIRGWRAGIPTILVGSVRWEHRWARETVVLRLRPWVNEVRGMIRFFGTYPYLMLSDRVVPRWLAECRSLVGQPAPRDCVEPGDPQAGRAQ